MTTFYLLFFFFFFFSYTSFRRASNKTAVVMLGCAVSRAAREIKYPFSGGDRFSSVGSSPSNSLNFAPRSRCYLSGSASFPSLVRSFVRTRFPLLRRYANTRAPVTHQATARLTTYLAFYETPPADTRSDVASQLYDDVKD